MIKAGFVMDNSATLGDSPNFRGTAASIRNI